MPDSTASGATRPIADMVTLIAQDHDYARQLDPEDPDSYDEFMVLGKPEEIDASDEADESDVSDESEESDHPATPPSPPPFRKKTKWEGIHEFIDDGHIKREWKDAYYLVCSEHDNLPREDQLQRKMVLRMKYWAHKDVFKKMLRQNHVEEYVDIVMEVLDRYRKIEANSAALKVFADSSHLPYHLVNEARAILMATFVRSDGKIVFHKKIYNDSRYYGNIRWKYEEA